MLALAGGAEALAARAALLRHRIFAFCALGRAVSRFAGCDFFLDSARAVGYRPHRGFKFLCAIFLAHDFDQVAASP